MRIYRGMTGIEGKFERREISREEGGGVCGTTVVIVWCVV